MKKKGKIIVLSCMIALLAVTAVFNFVFSTPQVETTTTSAKTANYFTTYRSERISNRNEELLQIDEVLNNCEKTSADYSNALNMKMDLAKNTENEMLVESLIKAYGFEDAVVVIGLDSNNVNVITKSADLSTDDAILIYSIVNDELNIAPENVKIIPIS